MQKGNLTLEITNTLHCNMACKYCFEREIIRKLKQDVPDYTDEYIKFIKKLLTTEWFNKQFSHLSLTFFGGESTVKPKTLIKFYENFKDYKNVSFFIISNGYYFPNSFKEMVKDAVEYEKKNKIRKLHIQLSYDGKPVHDIWRVDRKGNPTSHRVIQSLKWLKEVGCSTYLNAVINPSDFRFLYDVFLDYRNISEKYFNFEQLYNPKIELLGDTINQEEHEINLMYLKENTKKIIKYYLKNPTEPVIFSYISKINLNFCTVGNRLFGLYNGYIQPCHGFIYTKDEPTGIHNIVSVNDNINDIINKLENFRKNTIKLFGKTPEKCKKCSATICYRCNSITYDYSKKQNYWERWNDYGYNNYMCEYYRTFGKFYRIFQKLKKEG